MKNPAFKTGYVVYAPVHFKKMLANGDMTAEISAQTNDSFQSIKSALKEAVNRIKTSKRVVISQESFDADIFRELPR